ncbi:MULTISPECIES: agmatine deiminase family protein [Streptomyces]|uniref:Agmatine deiminase n=1 Tax=Streptomyces venezuelae (strain ATCC 10712 / CBS 650.69 / DSM 40230 / JCM 4526 / NBRC 13096 / PD 04745) TaxID=953739 RepID=F2RLK9_STRVP|nr:agmatine deiminase family protein [Streptomyces venezuelae]APE25715.1 peptide ABC transporter permease [Streptomyces venezuelae]QES03052.1 agmatine deiminase family protein [Streptomyces venezuelae ATCC 10712]CCA60389.1 Agmatine deiminase [Streptomyces venezuelae ATCC 10712]
MNRPEAHKTVRRGLNRRGFLVAAGLTAAGAALATTTEGRARAASAAGTFRVPVEDARHTRTWMAWPDSTSIWGNTLSGVQADIALIARTVAKYEPVVMCANSGSAAKARQLCGSTVTVISSIPVDDCWMRDSGPVFRTDGAGGLDAVGLNFNGWGNKQTHARDALVAGRVASYAGVPITYADLVGEGGAIEQDGAGTLMATRSSLVNRNRNPGVSERQLEAAMCAAYGASKVIWFDGVRGQDITDDHVDATSRFLAPGEALVQMPLASDNDAYARDARQQFSVLSGATTATRVPMDTMRLQGPDYYKIRSSNPDFLASYANFYLCNGAVISAHFGDTRADQAAKATLARLYPDRVIEQLNIDRLGTGGGGIHCVTQQQPAA